MAYNPALDGLRAIAVLLVMAFHPRIPAFPGGFVGVDIFFALSGFLITGLLLMERTGTGQLDLRTFYLRRFWRLMPPLAFMVVVHVIVISVVTDLRVTSNLMDALVALFYISDYTRAFSRVPHFFTHTWSLSVEVHFYLLWPLVIIGLTGCRTYRTRLIILATLYLAAYGWRWYEIHDGAKWSWIYFRSDTRLTGLIIGSMLACAHAAGWMKLRPVVADIIGMTGIVAIAYSVIHWQWGMMQAFSGGAWVVDAGAIALLIACMGCGGLFHRILSMAPLAYVGKLSYGLYLWHYPTMYFMRKDTHWAITFLTGSIVAFVMSAISYHGFEKWISTWRRRSANNAEEDRLGAAA